MKTSDRLAARLAAILSVFVGLWGLLAVAAVPFGAIIGGGVAALFGLVFGVLALLGNAWGWRKTALVGIAISTLALLVFAAEIVFLVFYG